MKIGPWPPGIATQRSAQAAAPRGASFSGLLASRDDGLAARDHRAMSFLERGLFSRFGSPSQQPKAPSSHGDTQDQARFEPSQNTALQPQTLPGPAYVRTAAAAKSDVGEAPPTVSGEALPAREISAGELTSAATSTQSALNAGSIQMARVPAMAAMARPISQRAELKTAPEVHLEAGDSGLFAVVNGFDQHADLDGFVEDLFRWADERGLPLAGLVLNGRKLTRSPLR